MRWLLPTVVLTTTSRFFNVMVAWLAYFILNGCDTLVVVRTAPTQSWTNPAERVMYVLNLALSNCALARQLMDDEFENNTKKCNSMTSDRKMAEELETRPVVVATSGFGDAAASVGGVVVASDVARNVVASLGVVATSMMINVNEEPHFDIDDELDDHMMDEENLTIDEGISFNDDDGDSVAFGLANRVEKEARSLTFKETYVKRVQPTIIKMESLIKLSILS